MSKMTRAWVEAQIERERERGCNPSAVRDLASLVIVRDYLSGGQYAVKPLEAMGMMLPFAMGQGMRDHNEIAIGEYRDQRTGAPEKAEHHREEHHHPEGDAHHMGAYPMTEQLTDEIATAWVDGMKNADPDHPSGPKWSKETTKSLAIKHGFNTPEAQLEFWAIMNMMYSDYAEIAKKHNVSTMDFYGDMAKAWMRDKDAVKNKTAAYITYCTE